MKVQNPAYASQSNALFVSHGSRAHCFKERPRPHRYGYGQSDACSDDNLEDSTEFPIAYYEETRHSLLHSIG